MSKIRTSAREGSGRVHEEERIDSTVKEGRFQKSEGGQARITSLVNTKPRGIRKERLL